MRKEILEKDGIKLGEKDFNNYMNVYAGTDTYYLYNGMVYMSRYNVNQLCYTGYNGCDIVLDQDGVQNVIKFDEYCDAVEANDIPSKEIFDKLKECY